MTPSIGVELIDLCCIFCQKNISDTLPRKLSRRLKKYCLEFGDQPPRATRVRLTAPAENLPGSYRLIIWMLPVSEIVVCDLVNFDIAKRMLAQQRAILSWRATVSKFEISQDAQFQLFHLSP